MFADEGFVSLPIIWRILAVEEAKKAEGEGEAPADLTDRICPRFHDCLESVMFAEVLVPGGSSIKVWPNLLCSYSVEHNHHDFIDMETGLLRWNPLSGASPYMLKALFGQSFIARGEGTALRSNTFIGICISILATILAFLLFRIDAEVSDFAHGATSILMMFGSLLFGISFFGALHVVWLEKRHSSGLGKMEGYPVVVEWKQVADFLFPTESPEEGELGEGTVVSPAQEARLGQKIAEYLMTNPRLTKSDVREIFSGEVSGRAFERAWGHARALHPNISKPGRKSVR